MELTSCSVWNLKDKTPLGSIPLLDGSFGRSLDPRTIKHPYAVLGIKHGLHWNVLFFKDTGIHQNISFKEKIILWLCVFLELFEYIPFPLILNIVNWFPKYLGPPERRKISRSKSETSRDGRDSQNSELIASMHEWEHTQSFSRYLMETKGHLHTKPDKHFNKAFSLGKLRGGHLKTQRSPAVETLECTLNHMAITTRYRFQNVFRPN